MAATPVAARCIVRGVATIINDVSDDEPNSTPLEVLILSYDSASVIDRLLASLAAIVPDTPVSIREHSDSPGAVRRLESLAGAHPAPVRISVDASNPGFGAGCNALAAGSAAEHLLFMNPDTELVTWPYQPALPSEGRLVGPLMMDSGDPSRHYGVQYRVRDEIARGWLRRSSLRPDGSGFVSGAALLIAKTDFDRIGGFDESYFLFYEDIDLCLRANKAGIGTYVDERFTVRHSGSHSTSTRFGRSLIWSYESAVHFHRAQGSPIVAYRVYVVVDAAMRAVMAILSCGDRHRARAYGGVARRAIADVVEELRLAVLRRPPTQSR